MSAELLSFIRRAARPDRAAAETDADLLARFAHGGDERAFEVVLARHAAMVLGVCRRLLPTGQDAEDAFQATFLALARAAGARRWDPSVANWLFTTARQVALNARRAAARRQRREQRPSPGSPPQDPLEALTGRELLTALDAELGRLPERLRAPLLLCCLQGLTRDEAAARLGLPLGTLKSRLERGRAALHAALAARGLAPAGLAALAVAATDVAASPHLLRSTLAAAGGAVPAPAAVLSLTDEVLRMMWLTRLKVAGLLGVSLLVAATAVSGLPTGPRATGADLEPGAAAGKTPVVRQVPELHVVGVYWSKGFLAGGVVEVDVRPSPRPVVLALTAYAPVTWRVRPAAGARVEKVIVSGYFAQEVTGLPPGVPVENRSYFPDDGSRRAGGWFYAYQWNSFPYREMVRRLNELTRLPVASFQGAYEGAAFVIDGQRGRDRAQPGLPPQAPAAAPTTVAALRAAAAGGQLHVVGAYSQHDASRPVDVEVRATPKPVVLALTAYDSVVWNVKVAPGARVSAVVASGYFPQEVDGVPPGVPFYRSGPDPSSHFGGRAGPRAKEYFYAYAAGTDDYRRTASALDALTGLPIATFQGEYAGTSFVVDGARGRVPAQAGAKAPDDVASVPSEDLRAGKDENKRYFLIGARKDGKAPKDGHGLVVVLPGGDGSADFLPFVKRLQKNALPEGYLVAQPVAVKWKDGQEIVWPSAKIKADGMKFTTEEFIDAVIDDVAARHKIDRSRVFTLTWSSSGPAAYAASLTSKKVTGSLVAMAVFNAKFLPPLEGAKGHAYYLYHSKADRVCPYWMAARAEKDLAKAGARVKLVEYDGGHGWRGDVFGDVRAGVKWLEENRARP